MKFHNQVYKSLMNFRDKVYIISTYQLFNKHIPKNYNSDHFQLTLSFDKFICILFMDSQYPNVVKMEADNLFDNPRYINDLVSKIKIVLNHNVLY